MISLLSTLLSQKQIKKRLLYCAILFTTISFSQVLKDAITEGKYIGTIVNDNFFNGSSNTPNGIYETTITDQFNALVAENDYKMVKIIPNRPTNIFDINTYIINTDKLDRLIDFSNANQIEVKRGHALIWFNQAPEWLNTAASSWSQQKIYAFATNYITKVITYRAGEINEWDVFNEIISDSNNGFRTGTWYANVVDNGKTIQDFLDHCFVVARNALTEALGETEGNKVKLFYNDYNIEVFNDNPNSKNAFMRDMVSGMVNREIPIDAVGLQGHFISPVDEFTSVKVGQTMDEMAALGLLCNITELDIRICNGGVLPTTEELEEQKNSYQRLAYMSISKPGSTGITLWGFTDAHSWIPLFFPECGNALIYDNNYTKKPAYYGLLNGLNGINVQDPCFNQPTVPQAPFLGSPMEIPGVIEFENYDFGGQNVSYNDIDSSNNGDSDYRDQCDAVDLVTEDTGEVIIGWTSQNEWLEYTINISESGNYNITFSTAADVNFGGQGSLQLDGLDLINPITFPSTGSWDNFQDTQVSNIALTSGEHILRFTVEAGSYNIDKMTFASSTLSINNDYLTENLKVYPAPFTDSIYLSYNAIETTQSLNLLDINGKKILSQNYNNEAIIKIDSRNIAAGMYFIELKIKNGITKVIKVIKQ